MDFEDVSECLNNMFLEEYILKFDVHAFYTTKKNQALIVNNFVYHLKTSKEESNGDNSRWVCRNTGCSASLSSLNFDITKINGK